jgi:hypothetical protein
MAKVLYGLCMVLACTLLVGCATKQEPFQPPRACLFTQVKAPISTKFQSAPVCSKKGEASAQYILIPCYGPLLSFSMDGCDIDKAAKNGSLSKVEYADYEYFSVLGIYQKTTVTAYGE